MAFYTSGREDPLLTVHKEYQVLGGNEVEQQHAYQDLFCSLVDEQKLNEIRNAVNRGWPLGGERFKDQIEEV